jgi:hypothetical protein
MHGLKNVHHFDLVIQALAAQTYRNFELIISDYLFDVREFNWGAMPGPGFPIFHTPITHSLAKNMGYCAICATRNSGIMFSSGSYLLFLDDCCTFTNDLLQNIVHEYQTKKVFTNALFTRLVGNEFSSRDCRWDIIEASKQECLVNRTDTYGYLSCSLESMLKLNGACELYDWSRNLEDIDLGKRLVAAGYKISINRKIFITEQEHSSESFCGEKNIQFKENLHCDGPILYMKLERRHGNDFIQANRRGFTPEEMALMKPCYKLSGEICLASSRRCCMVDNRVALMQHPDCDMYFRNPPIFDLANERQIRLSQKERYRVK